MKLSTVNTILCFLGIVRHNVHIVNKLNFTWSLFQLKTIRSPLYWRAYISSISVDLHRVYSKWHWIDFNQLLYHPTPNLIELDRILIESIIFSIERSSNYSYAVHEIASGFPFFRQCSLAKPINAVTSINWTRLCNRSLSLLLCY